MTETRSARAEEVFGPIVMDCNSIEPGVVPKPVPFFRHHALDGVALLCGAAGAFLLRDPLTAAYAAAWWVAVWVVIRSDLARFIIPDSASAAIAVLGLAHGLGLGEAPAADGRLLGLLGAGASGFAALALFWLTARIHDRLTGREGLGFGDVKLAGACGLWLEWPDAVMALEIAAVSALAVTLVLGRGRVRRSAAIPFGAFLAPAAWLTFVFGPAARAMLDAWR